MQMEKPYSFKNGSKTMKSKIPAFLILASAFALFIFATRSHAAFPSDADIKKISKADIIKTVQHLKSEVDLANAEVGKAKDETKAVQDKYDKKSAEADQYKADADKYKSEAHQNAKERDFWIVLGAVALAAYLGTLFAGSIVRNFPAPESYIIAVGVYVAVFGATYTAGRIFTHSIVQHLPF
jgi:hypothetical protein